MNAFFTSYIEVGKSIAQSREINWHISIDKQGIATPGTAWDLAKFITDPLSPIHWLRDFGTDEPARKVLQAQGILDSECLRMKCPLSRSWIELIKATAMEQLFSKRNSPQHTLGNVVRPLRLLATCAPGVEPWELRVNHIKLAYETAKSVQRCGKLADLLLGVVRNLIDANHIADVGPLFPMLSQPRQSIFREVPKSRLSDDSILMALEERKRADRLPEERAFWELVRIVFTESPRSYLDAIRFAMVKIMILTGLRINEVALLPLDWRREHEYFDLSGLPAGKVGGHSRCLSIRYFAEKQKTTWSDNVVLFENSQFVPMQFEEILTSTLDEVARISRPLRETLRLQSESGRLLPWYSPDSLVSGLELYPRITGNPILVDGFESELKVINKKYRSDFDSSIFIDLRREQLSRAHSSTFGSGVYQFFRDLKAHVIPRKSDGTALDFEGKNIRWRDVHFRVGEIEKYLQESRKTKLPDLSPLYLSDRVMAPWQLLMLVPKRPLTEGRSDGICDIAHMFSVGRADDQLLSTVLNNSRGTSLFKKYGETAADHELSINSHSFRHLQNSELFRSGVADTIITKRFGRKSVTQSYEYDHRSLSEKLTQLDLPVEQELKLGKKAATVAKLIRAGNANGPIVESFKEIQRTQGDDAAFMYLRVEADGFHTTPYGHCLNSFTVDPCPKHLECFSGCRHLSATGLPEHKVSLIKLEGRLKEALKEIEARPINAIGKDNQIRHIKERLNGVKKLLEAPSNSRVFPEGADLSCEGTVLVSSSKWQNYD